MLPVGSTSMLWFVEEADKTSSLWDDRHTVAKSTPPFVLTSRADPRYHTWGCTPVMTAVIFENYGAAQELIRARADVKAKTGRGLSLLQHAHLFCSSDSPLVRLIMAKD